MPSSVMMSRNEYTEDCERTSAVLVKVELERLCPYKFNETGSNLLLPD